MLLYVQLNLCLGAFLSVSARTITFSGRTWQVVAPTATQYPTKWGQYYSDSLSSVWVDNGGNLNMKLRKEGDKWLTPEVKSVDYLGFGTYTWEIYGNISNLDPKINFAWFLYSGTGSQGLKEIDFEATQWNHTTNKRLYYTIHPDVNLTSQGYYNAQTRFDPVLAGKLSHHHTIKWSPSSITMTSTAGYPVVPPAAPFAIYSPCLSPQKIPQTPMRAQMNIWLYHFTSPGVMPNLTTLTGPANGLDVHMIFRKFTFTPMAVG